uniref:Uncharacterized protein n=1 Tax=Tanacetum cinerariifolium TaxID=118510 RepID=A0A699HW08_TANCI|nr:hypothetical protein [Tanacetum cinerariifolium]
MYDMVNGNERRFVRTWLGFVECTLTSCVGRSRVLRHSLKCWEQEVPWFGATKNDAKRSNTFGSSSFNTEFENTSINLNVDARVDDEDDVHELQRPIGRDKAKGLKKKGAGSSSSMNVEVLARLMVSELTTQNESVIAIKKEERATFLKIKRRKVTCRDRELEIQEYKQLHKYLYAAI